MSEERYETEGTSYTLDLEKNEVLNGKGEAVASYEMNDLGGGEFGFDVVMVDDKPAAKVEKATQKIMEAYADSLEEEAAASAKAIEDAKESGELPTPILDIDPDKSDDDLSDAEFAQKHNLTPPPVNMRLGDKSPKVMTWRRKHRPSLFKKCYGVYGEVSGTGKLAAARKSSQTKVPDGDALSGRSYSE